MELSVRRAIYMWTNFWSLSGRNLAAEPTDLFNILLCTILTVLALTGLWQAFRVNALSAVPFPIALFCFPLVYYVTHPDYRRPIDPIFVILAVFAIVQWREGRLQIDEGSLTSETRT